MVHEVIRIVQNELKKDKTEAMPYSYYELSHSPLFEHIRNEPEFQQLLREQKPVYDEIVRKYRIK